MDGLTRSEFVELLGGMESRLMARLAETETRLDSLESTLKAYVDERLADLESRLKAYVDERLADLESRLKASVDERIADLETRLKEYVDERLTGMETKLLKAFFGYQEQAEVKFRKMSADVSNVNASSELRINNLEQRVIAIEQRLWMGEPPPPPAST